MEVEDTQKPPTELPAGGSKALSPQEFPPNATLFVFILKYATCLFGEERDSTAVTAGIPVPSDSMIFRFGYPFIETHWTGDIKSSGLFSTG